MNIHKQREFNYFPLLISLVVIAFIVIALATPRFLPNLECPIRANTGLLCPGCGGTTSVEHLLHGRISEAFQSNQLFVVAIFALLTTGIYSLTMRGYHGRFLPIKFTVTRVILLLIMILLFTIVRNVVPLS